MKEYKLSILNLKNFLIIEFSSIIIFLGLAILLSIFFNTSIPIFIGIPIPFLLFFVLHKIISKKVNIIINDDDLQIGSENLNFNNLKGCFTQQGLTMTNLSLLLSNNSYMKYTFVSSKRYKDDWISFTNNLKSKIYSEYVPNEEQDYEEVFKEELELGLSPYRKILILLIIVINAIVLYLIFFEEKRVPWQIFFVNIIVFGLIPKFKRNNTNT